LWDRIVEEKAWQPIMDMPNNIQQVFPCYDASKVFSQRYGCKQDADNKHR
jgi:hypothetical protein